MKVLGLSVHREHELYGPLDAVGQYTLNPIDADNLALKYVKLLWRAIRKARAVKPDVIIVSGGGISALIALAVSRLYGAEVLIRFAGYKQPEKSPFHRTASFTEGLPLTGGFPSLLTAGESSFNKFLYNKADGLLPVSRELKSTLVDTLDHSPSSVWVVPVPKDASEFRSVAVGQNGLRERYADNDVLVTVSNLDYEEKYRGVLQALDELKRVLAANEDAVYIVVGGGRYLDDLKDEIRTRELADDVSDRILITGHMDDVRPAYDVANVFVYVSYLDGYPNVVLEAQEFGLPVVANAEFGMREQVTDGETGYLFPRDRPEELRDAVEYLLNNPAERRAMGARAKAEMRQRNSNEAIGNRILSAVEEIRSSDSPRSEGEATEVETRSRSP